MDTIIVDTDIKTATLADDLRKLADFLETQPDVMNRLIAPTFYLFSYSEDGFRERNAQLGTFTKGSNKYSLQAIKKFGRVEIIHDISHTQVCEKKVVGTKSVTRSVPAVEVEMIDVTEEEEIVEWVCPESWK